MKKLLIAVIVFTLLLLSSSSVIAAKPAASSGCNKIKSGLITDSAGNTVTVGYDIYGYNYQSHMFNGTYDSSDRNLDGLYGGQEVDYADDKLMMKWSDPWLANVDCNNDGKLDRGLEDGVVGGTSKGWLTNHWLSDDGPEFVKIGWTGPGSPLWGQYTILQEVISSEGSTNTLGPPGFGLNDHWTSLP